MQPRVCLDSKYLVVRRIRIQGKWKLKCFFKGRGLHYWNYSYRYSLSLQPLSLWVIPGSAFDQTWCPHVFIDSVYLPKTERHWQLLEENSKCKIKLHLALRSFTEIEICVSIVLASVCYVAGTFLGPGLICMNKAMICTLFSEKGDRQLTKLDL